MKKRVLFLLCVVAIIAGCAKESKNCADPRLRDAALLKEGLIYYGDDPEDESFDDMYYAFSANKHEKAEVSEAALQIFETKVSTLQKEDKQYLKAIFTDIADLADLANYSYKDGYVAIPEGWVDLGTQDPNIAKILETSSSGILSSGLKCSLMAKGDRQLLVFAGSDFPSSWKNIDQVLGFIIDAYEDVYGALNADASQVVRAENVVNALMEAGYVDVKNLEFAGHSLGGRLASEMAVIYSCPAVVFNAAGVSPDVYQTYEEARASADESWRGYILDVVSANDPLTVAQKYMSGNTDPFTTKLAKVLSSEKSSVDEVVSLGLDILGAVVDNVTGNTQITDAVRGYGQVVDRLYERDYRAIGATLPMRENMEGHGIAALSAALRTRAEICN